MKWGWSSVFMWMALVLATHAGADLLPKDVWWQNHDTGYWTSSSVPPYRDSGEHCSYGVPGVYLIGYCRVYKQDHFAYQNIEGVRIYWEVPSCARDDYWFSVREPEYGEWVAPTSVADHCDDSPLGDFWVQHELNWPVWLSFAEYSRDEMVAWSGYVWRIFGFYFPISAQVWAR